MLSSSMTISLQQAMNSLWYSFKRLRSSKDNYGKTDKDVEPILIGLLDLKEQIEELKKTRT